MNLLRLQNMARERKYEQGKLGANNMLGINNKLTGKCVSNFAVAEVIELPVIKEVEVPVQLKVISNTIQEDLQIMKYLLPEYKIMNQLAQAYNVCVEAIEMAIQDGDLIVTETSTGYKAVLNR